VGKTQSWSPLAEYAGTDAYGHTVDGKDRLHRCTVFKVGDARLTQLLLFGQAGRSYDIVHFPIFLQSLPSGGARLSSTNPIGRDTGSDVHERLERYYQHPSLVPVDNAQRTYRFDVIYNFTVWPTLISEQASDLTSNLIPDRSNVCMFTRVFYEHSQVPNS
jgi:hypothetical protein